MKGQVKKYKRQNKNFEEIVAYKEETAKIKEKAVKVLQKLNC